MVVVSGGRVRKVTAYPVAGITANTVVPSTEMSARAILTCRPNSHPFQERTLILDTPVKVGRSVARARPASNNAIFDCKVLSRHHALLWYENGKFLLQDTKSSNGTFVNNSRLSEGGKESSPREVCSGDIVQFGVDVVENNRRVTHGCVIVTLKLYLPDGKEAKSKRLSAGKTIGAGTADELCRLAQHLREAARREQQLESKLTALQRLVEQAKQAAELGWRAAVDEDRLLSRVAVLESQLRAYSKNCTDDTIREELLKLQEDKTAYQNAAKDSLQKLHKERLDALDRVIALERAVVNAEEARSAAVEQCITAQDELHKIALQLSDSQRLTNELTEKLAKTETEDTDLRTKVDELLERERTLNIKLDTMEALALNPNILTNLAELGRQQLEQDRKANSDDDENINNSSEENLNDIQDGLESDGNKTQSTTITTSATIQEQIDILYKTLPQSIIEKAITQNKDKSENNHDQSAILLSPPKVLSDNDDDEQLRIVENHLIMEKELKERLQKENEELRQKLTDMEQMAKESLNEAQQMRDKLNGLLSDTNDKRTITNNDTNTQTTLNNHHDSSYITKLESTINILRDEKLHLEEELLSMKNNDNNKITTNSYNNLNISANSDYDGNKKDSSILSETDTQLLHRITELEDELVLIKEIHAQCVPERIKLEEQLQNTRNDLNILNSRSQTIIFIYTAPLILIIIYLLLSSIFA